MAFKYYGVDRGAQATTVTNGSSTTGKKIELAVDLTSAATRADVLLGLEAIREAILNDRTTAFAQ